MHGQQNIKTKYISNRRLLEDDKS